MKTLSLYFAIILINLFTLRATAQSKKHKFSAIQISTNVLFNNTPINNYSLVLFRDGVKLDSVFNEETESIDAIFQLNQMYTIQIKKAGFEDVIIMINTTVPEGLTQLSKKSQRLNINLSGALNMDTNSEENVEVLVIDKTLGLLVRKSNQYEREHSEVTSGMSNISHNSH